MWATRAGHHINEDAVAVTDHALVVIDGATGLLSAHVTGWPSDAQWFSHRLTALLAERLEDPSTSVPDILRRCLHALRTEFTKMSPSPATAPEAEPSASVIIARVNGPVLEVFSLGDCQAVVEHHDGSVSVCHDRTVEELDSAVVETMCAWAREHRATNKDARAQVTGHLLSNRRLKNTDGGYWIADLSAAGVHHGRLETFDAEAVSDLALMTDGFTATRSLVHLFDTPAQLIRALRTTSPERIIDVLSALLDADPDYATYPRLKHMDDSTVIHATLRSGS
ncbi:protein phosphatase 2C domain-containing protein [Kocuria sp. M1R5S2]|uniref:protein phosphatase 2C domain-containing protein n=1 Tax=Kocuria rhizosphaerae TaxID=3376285 RepID=UPI00379C9931